MSITEQFRREIANHGMTVVRDDGTYRHLRFKHPDTYAGSFDLITWPGHLCFTGDMGTYVFQRLPDMFEFFRHDADRDMYQISLGYWAQKAVAVDKMGGITEFNPDLFRQKIRDEFAQYLEDRDDDLSNAGWTSLDGRLQCEVLDTADQDQYGVVAIDAAMDFEHDGQQVFPDFWENNCDKYTHRFLWCCHALRWAIATYDNRHGAPGCD